MWLWHYATPLSVERKEIVSSAHYKRRVSVKNIKLLRSALSIVMTLNRSIQLKIIIRFIDVVTHSSPPPLMSSRWCLESWLIWNNAAYFVPNKITLLRTVGAVNTINTIEYTQLPGEGVLTDWQVRYNVFNCSPSELRIVSSSLSHEASRRSIFNRWHYW